MTSLSVVDQLAAVGLGQVLEGLLGERAVRRGGQRDAGDPVLPVQRLRGLQDRLVRRRRVQPEPVEHVPPVDQQLGPAVAGHAELLAAVLGQVEAASRERARAEVVDDLLRGVGVEQVAGVQRPQRGQRQRRDHVRQRVRGRGRDDRLVELVLADRQDVGLDAGLLGELLRHLLLRGEPIGRSSIVQTISEVPPSPPPESPAAAAAGRHQGQRGQQRGGACPPAHARPSLPDLRRSVHRTPGSGVGSAHHTAVE